MEKWSIDKQHMKNGRTKHLLMLLITLSLVIGASVWKGTVSGITVEAASVNKTLKTQTASIIKKKVKTSDSKKKKLEKLFKYAEKTWGYKRVIGFNSSKKGWEKSYALEMYRGKKGSCYHFAAAYAFLAKEATGYPVRIGIGNTNGFNKKVVQPHAWTEVKIGSKWYVCDTNLDKFAAKSSGKYFLKERSKVKSTYQKYKGVKYVNITI